jgi:kynurenine 3-monooxygenase
MLDELETMPNVKFFFNHKLTGADFKHHRAWFEVDGKSRKANATRNPEIEVSFDLLIGADGAHSAARYHMMKYTRMDYQQEYIDTLWSEFQIAPKFDAEDGLKSTFAISPNHLHIWPGKKFMFIAIPSNVPLSYISYFPVLTGIRTFPSHALSSYPHHISQLLKKIPPQSPLSSIRTSPASQPSSTQRTSSLHSPKILISH